MSQLSIEPGSPVSQADTMPLGKNHGCRQKKTEGTSSSIFRFGTAAKCCKLKRCADRVRSRTDNKDDVLEGKYSNLNFSLSTKKTT